MRTIAFYGLTGLCIAASLTGCTKKGTAVVDERPAAESCTVELKSGPRKMSAQISGMESSITHQDSTTSAVLAGGEVSLQGDEPRVIGTVADGNAQLVWTGLPSTEYKPAREGRTGIDVEVSGKVNFVTTDCNNDQLYLGAIHITTIYGEIQMAKTKGQGS